MSLLVAIGNIGSGIAGAIAGPLFNSLDILLTLYLEHLL